MTEFSLIETARLLVADKRGLLAMDESIRTCNKRFAAAGIPQTEAARRAWRELLITTPKLADSISGVILYDETIRQSTADGTPFLKILASAGILAGIKVDTGTSTLAGHAGEKVTEGLDGLRGRLAEYARLGARFAKWRAVFTAEHGLPSPACIAANAHALARYAALCQEAGLVPVVEPEVLMIGQHTLRDSEQATERVLHVVFQQLDGQGVMLEGMLLKPNMVLPGADSHVQVSVEAVAHATLTCLLRTVPAAVPGVVFLSGGQRAEGASARLNAINSPPWNARLPWEVSFSFGRAIEQPALDIWKGLPSNAAAAQQQVAHRAACNAAARAGRYGAATEQAAA